MSDTAPTSIEAMREQIEKTAPKAVAAAEEAPPAEDKPKDPRDSRVWTFNFEYTDSRGKKWEGLFTNKILSVRERMNAGLMKARLLGGTPIQSVDAYTDNLMEFASHLTYSLIKRPDWAKNLDVLLDSEDADLLGAIYGEVAGHEAHYFRRDTDQGPGEIEQSDDGDTT